MVQVANTREYSGESRRQELDLEPTRPHHMDQQPSTSVLFRFRQCICWFCCRLRRPTTVHGEFAPAQFRDHYHRSSRKFSETKHAKWNAYNVLRANILELKTNKHTRKLQGKTEICTKPLNSMIRRSLTGKISSATTKRNQVNLMLLPTTTPLTNYPTGNST